MAKNDIYMLIGNIAAALTTVSYIPGAVAIWKQRPKPAPAVSLLQYAAISIGITLWLIYGIAIRSEPVWLANAITLPISLSILIYKQLYG